MSELQWTLLGVGVGLVILVWVFNRIQEWRWHRMAKKTLGTVDTDPLLSPEGMSEIKQERADTLAALDATLDLDPTSIPVSHSRLDDLDVAAELEELRAEQSPETEEPVQPQSESESPTVEEPPHETSPVVVLQREDWVAPPDELIEYLVPLACTAPVTAKAIWQNLARASGNVRGMRWLGRRVTDGSWCVVMPDSDQRFDSLRAGLLLASRSGPIGELELERFCSMVSALATSMNLRVEFPPRSAALARATALDQFCAEVDVVVGINVVAASGQVLAGGRIARWADARGMILAQDGAYHLLDAQGGSLWRLANRDPRPFSLQALPEMTLAGVTFLLDVPIVATANEKLSPMFDAANILARELGARVLDDNGQVLGPNQLGRIERELAQIMLRMTAEDIPAGSSRARRLFSN